MRKFIGNSLHKLDAKGRVSLPAQFRKLVGEMGGGEIIVSPGLRQKHTLECFTPAGFDVYLDSLAESAPNAAAAGRIMARVAGGARELAIDDTGRVVIPAELRDYAGLSGEVRFVGTVATFQIWNPARFDAFLAEAEDETEETIAEGPWFDFHKARAKEGEA